jgi:hypothetical protein
MTGPTLSDPAVTTAAGTPILAIPKKPGKKMRTAIPTSAPSRNLRSRTKVTEPNSSSHPLGPAMNPEFNQHLVSEPKSKGEVKKVVKLATQVYRLTSAEIPKDATGIKVCIRVRDLKPIES